MRAAPHLASSYPLRLIALGAGLIAACGGGGGGSASGGNPPPAPVTITRDSRGVAHVAATTDAGAYFGAGYAAAEDRLFQMCWSRLQYQGRVAEFFGPGSLLPGSDQARNVYHDIEARLVGWRRHVEAEAQALDPVHRELLDAYAAGVNRVMALAAAGAPGHAPHPLFAQYGVPLEPWTAADCLGVWYRMARHYAFDSWKEARNLHLVEELRGKGLDDAAIRAFLFGSVVCDDDAAVVREDDVAPALRDAMAAYAQLHGLDAADSCPGGVLEPHFSQAVAVGSTRAAGGRALLVADPRVQIFAPSLFHEIHVRGATFDVRGLAAPGSPNFLVGATPHLAWGVTALGLDQGDLFRVQVAPGDGGILVDGRLEPWIVDVDEMLLVKGGPDLELEFRTTRFGPLVTPLVLDAHAGEQYALRALPASHPGRSTTAGFHALYGAADAAEFRARLASWDYPSANVVFADAGGRVGYVAAGAWPVRAPGQFLGGWAAQDGTTAAADWIGLLPHDLRPWVLDPAAGLLFSANHAPIGSWYPLPQPWGVRGDQDRSRRLRELLEAPVIAREDLLAARGDAVSPAYRDAVVLAVHAGAEQGHVFGALAEEALSHLQPWLASGATLTGTEPGVLLASLLPTALRFTDPAGAELVPVYGGGASGLAAYLKRKVAGLAHTPPEALDALDLGFLEAVLARALTRAEEIAGPSGNWAAWYHSNVLSGSLPRWTTLEQQDPLEPGEIDFAGLDCADTNTLRAAPAACFGLVWEAGAPDATRSLLPFGQSERPGHPHELDQYGPWLAGELAPAPFTPAGVAAIGIEAVLELDFP